MKIIEKNTKFIFQDLGTEEEVAGGIPLSEGEQVKIKDESGEERSVQVIKKETELIKKEGGYVVNTIYTLENNST